LRVLRDDEWPVRREPFPECPIIDDPVPVVIDDDEVELDRVESPAVAAPPAPAFTSAWPQTSQ
jgi:hypothetical protein